MNTRSKTNLPPLAERMRPETLEEFVGQEHLLGQGQLLSSLIQSGNLPSMIFWGEPGTGKTTLARILAKSFDVDFVQLSAVTTGVADLRKILSAAEKQSSLGRATLLFIDEIHRWSKSQQDALLHAVEDGTVILLGATTENPSFEVISPLLSRARVLRFQSLTADHLKLMLKRALTTDSELSKLRIQIDEEATSALLALSGGDGRALYNALELAVNIATPLKSPRERGEIVIDRQLIEKSVLKRMPIYDKKGDSHYDTISAFIKCVRASDPDAAVYYLARMLNAGEDPLFVARRLIILASEDIGNANPNGLVLAQAGYDAVHSIGMPEARIVLAQVTTYLASSPKSNAAYMAIDNALDAVRGESFPEAVPLHLRNPVTGLMKSEGYGEGYVYPHERPGHFHEADNLPSKYKNKIFYSPSDQGRELEIGKRLEQWWKKRQNKGDLS
ncbi:replication-associated recombination protein A [bacterium]|nr:replication-associated recombination protein A [bacterium]MBU1636985.1 replication-associated recombination protein A [bacterium]